MYTCCYSNKLIKGRESKMFNQLHQFRGSKQVIALATMSYWSAIETLGNDRAPSNCIRVREGWDGY